MTEIDYPELQRLYPGRFIAQRDGEVVAAEPTYDALVDELKRLRPIWGELLIEYVERPDVVAIY